MWHPFDQWGISPDPVERFAREMAEVRMHTLLDTSKEMQSKKKDITNTKKNTNIEPPVNIAGVTFNVVMFVTPKLKYATISC